MSHSQNQVEDERFILDKFFSVMNIQAESIERGLLVDGNHKPDFVVCIDGSQVGIEETTYYRKQRSDESRPRQAKESAWNDLKSIIEEKRQEHSELSEIHGSIRFRDFMLPPPREHLPFADELLEFAASKIGGLSSEYERHRSFSKKYSHLNRYVEYLELKHVRCFMYWDWRHNAEYVGLQEDELFSIIRSKIDKHVENQVDENWLLITSGTRMSQQMGYLPVSLMNGFDEVRLLLSKSPFDRIYICDYVRSRVVVWTVSKGWEDVLPAKSSN